MDVLQIPEDATATRLESLPAMPQAGLVWISFYRETDTNWPEIVKQITGISIDERHISDGNNVEHRSFSDSTTDYEMVIFRSLAPDSDDEHFATRPTAFFLFDRLLITIAPEGSRSIDSTITRLLQGRVRLNNKSAAVMHLIMNRMVDRFLAIREILALRLADYREALLDEKNPFEDWRALLRYQKNIMTLEKISEAQSDTITSWREDTDTEIDDNLHVRFHDLLEHIRRVSDFCVNQQREIDSMVQLHFSAVAHRTNEIVRLLTLISAIFLPLTLIAGIFGMNFENMPELKTKYGYFFALGGMGVLATALLIYFKIRKWI
jgi:magnesium transporter